MERSLLNDYTVGVGYTFSLIRQLPVATDINLINPVGALADGRPIYGTAVSASSRPIAVSVMPGANVRA